MTKADQTSLDEQLPGLQLAFFEVIWPIFPWIKSIWIKERKGQFELFVEASAAQDKKKLDKFNYLVGEVFNAEEDLPEKLEPDSQPKIRHTIRYGAAVPHGGGYQELMSDRVFKNIAKKHAPWRLERGR